MTEPKQQLATFEQALKELEAIVRQLEDGDTGLEQALMHYELGVGLLKRCYSQLSDAEKRTQLLTGETADGQAITQPFEHIPALTKAKR